MNIVNVISRGLQVHPWQTEAVIRLIDEGCTIPFIARYRKEQHGALNDEQLRTLEELLHSLRALEERRTAILSSISAQGKLTDALQKSIEAAESAVVLEDLYLPYRPKRRTRAMQARERGLLVLALCLLSETDSLTLSLTPEERSEALPGAMAQLLRSQKSMTELAELFVRPDQEVPDAAAALQGAQDIVAEAIADQAELRAWIRKKTWQEGVLASSAKDPKAASVYENYYAYGEPLRKIPGHRVLALNRGEKEKLLSVRIEVDTDSVVAHMDSWLRVQRCRRTAACLHSAAADAYRRLLAPSIASDLRNQLTEQAEANAIALFGSNLHQLLLQPPLSGYTVLGWDPAFRTGCKLAVSDPTGRILDTAVIYPVAPHKKTEEAEKTLLQLIRAYSIDLISLGNGTASRESEQFIAGFIRKYRLPLRYVIVNEAGASVYSASSTASQELPMFDVGQRSAASIARRLQDPLAELVKIDPRSIGVGQYQHDMNQTRLRERLEAVLEDAVNRVGVDLNTASPQLLSHISGISAAVAGNIVAFREANGKFTDRRQLLKVSKLGPRAFQQCAGFLRIRDGKNPLDNTAVHPESYEAAQAIMKRLGITPESLRAGQRQHPEGCMQKKGLTPAALAEDLGIGLYTLTDILAELEKPGRDPREEVPAPVLRSDILELTDLKPGMILQGTVRNVIDFGAFVDIGVHQDGLVHISQLSDSYVHHPLDVVSVGDIVQVRVLNVDTEKRKISLSMKELPQ